MLSCGCCHVTGHVILWMLTCHRTLPSCFIVRKICCPMDDVLWQDTLFCGCCHVTGHSPLFYYEKNMLSCGCCHVTGHVVLWMLSCHRTRCPVDVFMSQDTPSCFIMGKICCTIDVVMWQNTLSCGCCLVTWPPVDVVMSCFIIAENVIHSFKSAQCQKIWYMWNFFYIFISCL